MARAKFQERIAKIKAAKSQQENLMEERFNHFLLRTRELLSRRGDKQSYIVSIPFRANESDSLIVEDAFEITENLMKRLQVKVNKNKAYLANPIVDGGLTRPLFIDELIREEKGKKFSNFAFAENDILYISGHANFFLFSGFSPLELAKQYYEFLKDTGIKIVKLAGCNTGSRFYEHNLPPLEAHKPEELTHSYAMKFSQALLDLGLENIMVYGYRGILSDQRKKNEFAKVTYHSFVDLPSFFNSRIKIEEVRGHTASVRFKDGCLIKEPLITADSVFDYGDKTYSLTY